MRFRELVGRVGPRELLRGWRAWRRIEFGKRKVGMEEESIWLTDGDRSNPILERRFVRCVLNRYLRG